MKWSKASLYFVGIRRLCDRTQSIYSGSDQEEHIYAKVIQQSNVDEHVFLLGFTAVLPKAM
ncbi:MAG: hypothetical protein V7L29_32180 [Nostoc sp.]|uniref:hypothetical protein n=1 Tax=Nostoc sp. TaxID=1180 RepID=UPI002FF14FC5